MQDVRNSLKFFLKREILGALCLLLGSGGCALLGSGNVPVPHATGYHVNAPRKWKAMSQSESDEAYRLPSGDIVALNSSCTAHSKAPLEVLTKTLLLGDRDIHFMDQQRLPVDGTQGLFSAATAKMAEASGDLFHFRLFVLSKGGCVFDFSLISPRPIPAAETEEFLRFVNSFKYGTR